MIFFLPIIPNYIFFYCRMYIPESLYNAIVPRLVEETAKIKMGSALEQDSFLSAVIDEKVRSQTLMLNARVTYFFTSSKK